MHQRKLPSLLLSLLAVTGVFGSARADELADADEQLARKAKVGTDGASLLAFFRSRSLTEADLKRIETAIEQLGSPMYAVREQASLKLAAYGPPIRPFLIKAAQSPDLEIVRRATRCLEEIDRGPGPSLSAAAVRLLVLRKPAEAVRTLLAYLPFGDDETVEEEVVNGLAVLALHGEAGDRALSAALADPLPARRAAAAFALGKVGAIDYHAAVRKLLTDPDPKVRLRSAQGLAYAKDKEAVPVLIALLGTAPAALCWQAEEILYRLAQDKAPQVSLGDGDAEARKKCVSAWTDWWRAAGPGVDLNVLKDSGRQLGLTVVAELNNNVVWECGPDGKPRWQLKRLQGPMDVQILPGGRVLIAENSGMRVTERDLKGNVLWEKRVPNNPIVCQRLPNGNTFIATYQGVLEVTRDGHEVYSHHPGGPGSFIFGAQRLRNGHIVCISAQNSLIELDSRGKEIKRLPVATQGNWGSVESLPGGRFLVTVLAANKVMELDGAGKVLWEVAVQGACFASRLPSGNTLVACMNRNRVIEIDRKGKTVWEKVTAGTAFRAHRR